MMFGKALALASIIIIVWWILYVAIAHGRAKLPITLWTGWGDDPLYTEAQNQWMTLIQDHSTVLTRTNG